MNSRKLGSSHLITLYKEILPALRNFPLLFATLIGIFSDKKNFYFLFDLISTSNGGTFNTSIIIASYSFSFSPGNRGKPVYSSTIMQPKLHISIDIS